MLEGQAFPTGGRRAALAELLGNCQRDEIEAAVDLLIALLDLVPLVGSMFSLATA